MFEEFKDKIIGGAVVLLIGGTGFAVSQTDVVNNFANETGMSQAEAEQYSKDAQKDLASFAEIGQDFIDMGNTDTAEAAKIDCANYSYDWESASIDCATGKSQLQTIGDHEVKLGDCYKALDTNLESAAKSKMRECMADIDTVNSDYELPISVALMKPEDIADLKKTNIYNKSILKTALGSE